MGALGACEAAAVARRETIRLPCPFPFDTRVPVAADALPAAIGSVAAAGGRLKRLQ